MDTKRAVHVSKFLSLVLRHSPESAGVTLDAEGWVEVEALLAGASRQGVVITRAELEEVVATNDKQRFALSGDRRRIRARQGHSRAVDLGLRPTSPPAILFHGTVERFVDSILRSGLQKKSRQHVHLSPDTATAERVGGRRGKAVVLRIAAGEMANRGHQFFQSENGVWLTEAVPPEFISRNEGIEDDDLRQSDVTILYRPVGPKELALIRESGFTRFPPRLPEQPIFYPVVHREYAEQIARDWNARQASSDYSGFVTEFGVDDAFLSRYTTHQVGTALHVEYWIPAGELEAFNDHIRGPIRVVAEFRGTAQTAV